MAEEVGHNSELVPLWGSPVSLAGCSSHTYIHAHTHTHTVNYNSLCLCGDHQSSVSALSYFAQAITTPPSKEQGYYGCDWLRKWDTTES